MMNLFLLLALFLTCHLAHAQQVEPDTLLSLEGVVYQQEIALLHAQIELMREHNQDLLQTVLWSLGSIFVVVTLLAGFGWYANFRLYERDKEALMTELRDMLERKFADTSQMLATRAEEIEKSLRDQVVSEIDSLRKRLEGRIDSESRNALYKINAVRLDTIRNEADQAIREDSYSWALHLLGEALGLCQELQKTYMITDILDKMREAIKSSSSLPSHTAAGILSALSSVPEQFRADVEGLQELVRLGRNKDA